MKHAHPAPKITAVLAGLAVFVWSIAAPASAEDSAATTKPDVNPALQVSPASGPIHYYFDETPLDRSNHAPIASYADMLGTVTPGVVCINPSRKIVPVANSPARPFRGRNRGYYNTPPQNIPPDLTWTDAQSNKYIVMGVGSGCIISSDGYIVTNHHVITDDRTDQPADGFLVKLPDGREFEGKLIGSDKLTDLALIKINAKNLPVIKMADSEKIKVGDIVFAVGNPMDVGLTVTHGIVSATGRSELDLIGDTQDPGAGDEDFIQTDAAINPGNSGGPLVDVYGRLVGLNTAIVSNSSDGGSIGIGFAIPSSMVRKVSDDLIKDGKVRRGALGVQSQEITSDIAQVMGLPGTHGALITDFSPANGPAASSGLKHGDVIVKINDDEVDSPSKLHYLVALSNPGSTINLTVLRDGEPKVFKVRLADHEELFGSEPAIPATIPVPADNSATPRYTPEPPPVPAPTAVPAPRNVNEILEGVSLIPLTEDLRKQMSLPDKDKVGGGLVITDVARNSPYFYEFGNRTVVITEVNQKPVTSLEQLRALLKPGAVNQFYVYRTDTNGGSLAPAYVTETLPAGK